MSKKQVFEDSRLPPRAHPEQVLFHFPNNNQRMPADESTRLPSRQLRRHTCANFSHSCPSVFNFALSSSFDGIVRNSLKSSPVEAQFKLDLVKQILSSLIFGISNWFAFSRRIYASTTWFVQQDVQCWSKKDKFINLSEISRNGWILCPPCQRRRTRITNGGTTTLRRNCLAYGPCPLHTNWICQAYTRGKKIGTI